MVQESESRRVNKASPSKPGSDFPWLEATGWMLLLGLFFLVGYRLTNSWAASHPDAMSLHTTWDDKIPFLAWSIVPYLSLNILFPCTFFVFEQARLLRLYAARIVCSQIVCFGVFALVPSANVRLQPQAEGAAGVLFKQLRAFEQPCNMFPSLHAATLLLVWLAWLPVLKNSLLARWAWHGWCLLILLSTLTTWQHDFLDVLTGLGVGWVTLLVVPFARQRHVDATCRNH